METVVQIVTSVTLVIVMACIALVSIALTYYALQSIRTARKRL